MTSHPRIAIVGAGLMGRWHAYYAARRGTIAAIVDPLPERAATLARRHRVAALFSSLDDCLRQGSVDAVHLCTPSETHADSAKLALDAGKHVLIEKPVALNARRAEALVEAADRNGVVLAPVHQFPFQRGFARFLGGVELLGRPVEATFTIRTAGGDGLAEDARARLLVEILPHPLSVFAALFGLGVLKADWRVLNATGDELEMRCEHEGAALRIDLSLRARPTCNHLSHGAEEGTAAVDFYHGFSSIQTGSTSRWDKATRPFRTSLSQIAAAGSNLAVRALNRQPAYPGLDELIVAFYRAVAGQAEPPIAAEETIAVSRLLEAASRARTP